MKLKLLTAAATAALMAAPSLASADDSGWYLRGNVGVGAHTNIKLSGDVVGGVQSTVSPTYSLGGGYDFGAWRLELDGTTLWTDLGKVGNQPQSSSKLRTNSMMLNAIYDFSDFGRWEPYVGAGIGRVRSKSTTVVNDFPGGAGNLIQVNNPACPSGFACGFKDSFNTIGWQILAGVGYNISDKLVWDTHYRYLDAGTPKFKGNVSPAPGFNHEGAFKMENAGAHSLMTGFRYKFGAPTPPPMKTCWDGSSILASASCPAEPVRTKICWNGDEIAATAACPAQPVATQTCWDGSEIPATATCPARQTYTCPDGSIVSDESICALIAVNVCNEGYRSEIIKYEFNKGRSAETRNAISSILNAGQYCEPASINVVGHTDTSGSAAYNLGLSKRRAADARQELVRQGVPASRITSEGKGETEPRVQTGDGVRNADNRRTEVLVQFSTKEN